MNLSSDPTAAAVLVEENAVTRLQMLTTMADAQLAAFAEYSLVNMRESILHQSAEKLYQQRLRSLAATELQSGYRRMVAMKTLRSLRAQRAENLRRWRSVLVIRRFAILRVRSRRRKEHAAVLAQHIWRARLARALRRRLLFERNVAARKIQRAYRAHRGYGQMAAIVQAAYRGQRMRREAHKRNVAAQLVQRSFREHLEQGNTRAALLIQARFRFFVMKKYHPRAERLQNAYRLHAKRRRNEAVRAAAELVVARPRVGSRQREENRRIKGKLVTMAPNATDEFNPASWFATEPLLEYSSGFTTTMESTAEADVRELEQVSSSKDSGKGVLWFTGLAGGDSPTDGASHRASERSFSIRADDRTTRTVLEGADAQRAARSNTAQALAMNGALQASSGTAPPLKSALKKPTSRADDAPVPSSQPRAPKKSKSSLWKWLSSRVFVDKSKARVYASDHD